MGGFPSTSLTQAVAFAFYDDRATVMQKPVEKGRGEHDIVVKGDSPVLIRQVLCKAHFYAEWLPAE